MGGLTEQEFTQLSQCIEIAYKVESQKLSMVQGAQLAIELDRLRGKVKALVAPAKESEGK
jgi:hypothetical protein